MVIGFERRWKPEWDSKILGLKINRHDFVTMASIVEREARLPEERPVIAAVYYNRLQKGMLLQADPTVQYALGHHVGRVLYRDLKVESPYNTYMHKGLPPGPIGSPGAASLAASADPANVPYLYFVASRDGHHEFRTTLADHNGAIKQVRAVASKDTARKNVAAAKAATSRKTSTRARVASRRTTSKTSKPAATVSKLTSNTSSKAGARKTTRTAAAKKRTTTRKKPI
jgi:hypothetical protein